MEQFNQPAKLNGAQLLDELKAASINASKCFIDGNGNFFIDVPTNKKTAAETIVNSHVGIDTEPSLIDKLTSIGLSIDELKAALA